MRRWLFLVAALMVVAWTALATTALGRAAGPTLVQLATPPAPAGLANVHWGYCAASGFNADGSIAGVCQYSYGSSGGSGRGGGYHPAPTASYTATWSAYGQIVGLGAQCGCVRNYQGTGTVVTINGVPYYYVATDASSGNELVSSNVSSFLVLQTLPPAPAAPSVSATLSGLNLQVNWTPASATAAALTSSAITAVPAAGSSAPTLTATVGGAATTATLGPVQPQTTYTLSVVNVDAGGSGAPGTTTITTPASSVVPAAPTISYLWWSGSTGSLLAVSWAAPAAGDSPIDAYQVQVSFVDGDNAASGPYNQSLNAQTLSAYFPLDNSSSWSVQVRAHNAAGWGAWSAPRTLGGL